MNIPLLTATELSYHSQDCLLLNNITLTLHHGQKVTLVGRSGSGKSLLLQVLADLLPLGFTNANRIMLNKNGILTPISQIAPTIYRSTITLFHQSPNLTDGTVLENLYTPYSFKHHKHQVFDKTWHLDKLAKLGKTDRFLTQSIHELSGGERQIVSFLRTLQFNPTIALFDETTSALDEDTAQNLIDLVLDWHDETKAFIWVTHNPNENNLLKADMWHINHGILTT